MYGFFYFMVLGLGFYVFLGVILLLFFVRFLLFVNFVYVFGLCGWDLVNYFVSYVLRVIGF